MVSQGMFSIGGIVSGLDTSSIVAQLLQLERQPVVRLQQTQAALRKTDDAWAQVATRLGALRTATDAIARPDRFSSLVAVSSSNPDAVGVTRSVRADVGALSFAVERLAAAHQVGVRFPSADTPLAGERVTVQAGEGAAITVELDGRKTLQDVARELNAAKGGVTAAVVRGDGGDDRLVLTATQTGTRGAITVSGVDGAVDTLRAAADAVVIIGSGPEAIRVTRPQNTIDDLVPGATVTLRAVTTQPVHVTAARDVDGAVAAVRSYVEALNGAVSTLRTHTGYNADAKVAGALQGDGAARQLLDGLRAALSAPPGAQAGRYGSAFQVGLQVDRHGAVVLDETALRAALSDDFDAVARLFGRTGTATSSAASAVVGTAATAPGTYEVRVTRAAEPARSTGAVYDPPADAPVAFRVSSAGRTVEIRLDAGHSDADAAARHIAAALQQGGITGLTATAVDGRLQLFSSAVGASAAFTVAGGSAEEPDEGDDVFGLAGAHRGADVAGEIRLRGTDAWSPLQGVGRELVAASGQGIGLSVSYDGPPGAFDVTFAPGLTGGVARALAAAEGVSGTVARARNGISSRIGIYQTRIDAFDQRLATREATLRRQFTAMETALSSLNAQGSWLTSQLAGLSNLHRR